MRSTATPQLVCDRCEEPVDDCVCREADRDEYDRDSSTRSPPPTTRPLAELDTIAAFTDEGRVIQVIDHGIRTAHVYLDNDTGDVYNVPPGSTTSNACRR